MLAQLCTVVRAQLCTVVRLCTAVRAQLRTVVRLCTAAVQRQVLTLDPTYPSLLPLPRPPPRLFSSHCRRLVGG